ncbi:host specificity protein [Rhodobacterales bacterium LSUCC0031]|nr:host specificity protein [Rhodobacterales bacterium LSUCC0031]
MATILLSAAGAAIGGMATGPILGLSGAIVGRAVGATLGRVIDQRLMATGSGSEPVERGRVDRFRITGASEGAPIAQLFGRMRLSGQVIWATHFVETVTTSGGGGGGRGKGAAPRPAPTPVTTTYSYSVSLALALCEGEIRRVGRIWADGVELDQTGIAMRVYQGSQSQMPDPLIAAVEGAGHVPAYRGIAYVVIEDLDLSPFGNRVPQFAFEVVRPAQPKRALLPAAADLVRAVALMPGTGEYALSTRQITLENGFGHRKAINTNTQAGGADFNRALGQMRASLPNLRSVSLIYSWFGDDLRAGTCKVRPKVEDTALDGVEMPWRAGGIGRAEASILARVDGRPIYGGTPADASVIEAIQAIHDGGQEVMLYPFLLMEILQGNGLPDPYGRAEQPPLPWRGRMTAALAPGMPASPDRSAANGAAVASFFGTARANHFTISPGAVLYAGPDEWSYSRFILHAAALAAAAGGVDAFCIGSEMRGLTQMRDAQGFPAVTQLIALAAEVRALLPVAKLSYAADWSEYFGYQPQDGTGDVYFHLDPLWADANIDFIAIDNYMPLSDWRDGDDHADSSWGEIYDLDYLQANIAGGEGYDWYYPTQEARAAQRREPITDGQYGEPWTFRYKDLRGWWSQLHHNRINGPAGWAVAHGDRPDLWTPVAGATLAPVAGEFVEGRFRHAVEIVDAAGNYLSRVQSADFLSRQDTLYQVRLFYRAGTASYLRLTLDHRGAAVEWIYVVGPPGNLQPSILSGHVVQAVENITHVDGTFEFRCEIIPKSTDPRANFGFGPGNNIAGHTVVFVGLEVTARALHQTPWIPGSKPVRFTEIGCPAVDKGSNEPNKFFDPKSDESALPRHSSGRRDDVIQAQYLRAIMSYWDDPAHNPISAVYGGPMLAMDYAHVWAWDARPWPAFPNETGLWSDGANWRLGHWVTGRIEAAPLDRVVAELCEGAGVDDYDVSALFGLVRGHISGETESARARLQALMLSHGFQAVERDGKLVFLPLPRRSSALISQAETAYEHEDGGGISETRAAEVEVVGRVRVSHVAAEAGYEDRVAEAVFPGDGADGVTALDLPLAMTAPEGQAVAERWLAEARIARDQLRLILPPSRRALGAGEMVALQDGSTWRIDRIEDRGVREIEAVRVEPTSREPSDAVEEFVATTPYIAPVPVSPVFLDLPLLSGAEVEHAPHLAISAVPWPGTVAAYAAPAADGFVLNRLIERRAVIGRLVTPLRAAPAGLWDRGAALRVQLPAGQLAAADLGTVLNGGNVAAIGMGDEEDWEVIQFAGAQLVGENLWEIGMRLRGQQGTDAIMPAIWPEGSLFVLLDGAPVQIDLPIAARGLARHYRVGPALRAVDDASYVERVRAFRGVGLRPFAPAHLRARKQGDDLALTWVRRTRIDGDSWEGFDVPLGEASEQYLMRVWVDGAMRRETVLSAPVFTYAAAMRAGDGVAGGYAIEVAQLSDRYGPGPFTRIEIDD